MTLSPILALDPATQLHLGVALAALVLGPFVLFRSRRDARHKALGRVWASLMALVAGTSFAIESTVFDIWFGPIHFLSLYTLVALAVAVRAIVKGNVALHRRSMIQLYLFALILPGLFTLVPGRALSRTFFAGEASMAWIAIAGGVVLVVTLYRNAGRLVKITP